jgi:hypothetical protein
MESALNSLGVCRFEASYANVISGEEEGVYGWIAVNYLNGHLAPSALPAPIVSRLLPAFAVHNFLAGSR